MQAKKTIVILNWRAPKNPKSGGAERVTLKHALEWTARGYRVVWISGRHGGQKFHQVDEGIEYIAWGPSSLFFLFAWALTFCTVRGPIHCIIDEVHGFPAWSTLWAPKIPKIVFIHELATTIWDEMYPKPISWVGKLIESHLFPRFYKTIPVWVDAPSMIPDLIGIGFSSQNITVIPCAIDPLPAGVNLQDKEKNWTCIIVSRLVAMKGIHFALEVFQHVQVSIPEAKLWIVGDGDTTYIEKLHTFIKKSGLTSAVKFYGGISERKKYELLARSHLLLHTSIREGFGLTVLEAESVGTPTAVFSVSGLQDLVQDGENGVRVPFADTHALAKKIIRLKTDKKAYTNLCKGARVHAKKFRWTAFTKQSTQLLEKVMNKRSNV